MTALIVALLTFPLAALRPFQQPAAPIAAKDEFPQSFKVSILPAVSDASAAVTQAASDGVTATTSTTAKTAMTTARLSHTSQFMVERCYKTQASA